MKINSSCVNGRCLTAPAGTQAGEPHGSRGELQVIVSIYLLHPGFVATTLGQCIRQIRDILPSKALPAFKQ